MDRVRALDRRLLLALAGLTGAVLGWCLLVTVLADGGDGGGSVTAPAGRAPAPTPSTTAPGAPAVAEVALAPEPRDPFRQLATVPRTGGSGQPSPQISPAQTSPAQTSPAQTSPAQTSPAQISPAQTSPLAPSQPAPQVASVQPRPQPAAGPAGAKASLELKAIAPDASGVVRATITVDGRSFTPARGEVFSHGYRLERVEGGCVDVGADTAKATMCLPR